MQPGVRHAPNKSLPQRDIQVFGSGRMTSEGCLDISSAKKIRKGYSMQRSWAVLLVCWFWVYTT